MQPEQLRQILRDKLNGTVSELNKILAGQEVDTIKATLERIGRNNQLPHWYSLLESGQSMPNLDGKTIGSVIEMVLVGVLENYTFKGLNIEPLTINPAKGVDIPQLELGVKSPSENYCTSEPFFSAYDRILGSEYDALILLTDYQTAKKNPPPVRIQIKEFQYLYATQIADKNLCEVAQNNRDFLAKSSVPNAKKILRFLAHINKSNWRAKTLLKLVSKLQEEYQIEQEIHQAEEDFKKKNKAREKISSNLIAAEELEQIVKIREIKPIYQGVIQAADDWVIETYQNFARLPNENEWHRFLKSPLDGKISISFALQWRYSFGGIFGKQAED